jgi:drug/metabolite transporter (DMT)-like permease
MEKRTKAEKIYNVMETIEEYGKIIFGYLFIFVFAISFLLIGLFLFFTPPSDDIPKWALIIIGMSFIIVGFVFLFKAIKYALEEYLY